MNTASLLEEADLGDQLSWPEIDARGERYQVAMSRWARWIAMARKLSDREFVAAAREVIDRRPFWIVAANAIDLIRFEIQLRLLLSTRANLIATVLPLT